MRLKIIGSFTLVGICSRTRAQEVIPVVYYVVTCYYLVTQKLTQSFCSNRKPPYAWNMIKPDASMSPMRSWLQSMCLEVLGLVVAHWQGPQNGRAEILLVGAEKPWSWKKPPNLFAPSFVYTYYLCSICTYK